MEGWWPTLLGAVAGVCTSFSFVPQVQKAWQGSDTAAISKRMYVISLAAFGLWIVHGIMIGSVPIILFNAVNIVCSGLILALKLRGATSGRRRSRPGRVMSDWLPLAAGLVAGCLSTYSLVPQVLKIWREGDAEAVSKRMFAVRAFGLALWAVYGYVAGSLPITIFSSLSLLLSAAVLVLKARAANGGRTRLTTVLRPGPLCPQPCALRSSGVRAVGFTACLTARKLCDARNGRSAHARVAPCPASRRDSAHARPRAPFPSRHPAFCPFSPASRSSFSCPASTRRLLIAGVKVGAVLIVAGVGSVVRGERARRDRGKAEEVQAVPHGPGTHVQP